MLSFHIVFDLSAINVHLCGRFSFLVGELLKDARNRNSNPNKKRHAWHVKLQRRATKMQRRARYAPLFFHPNCST